MIGQKHRTTLYNTFSTSMTHFVLNNTLSIKPIQNAIKKDGPLMPSCTIKLKSNFNGNGMGKT